MRSAALHHVSIPVRDVERSRSFYRDVLGLHAIRRPPFDFPGAWFALGAGELHLIGDPHDPTFRDEKRLNPGDMHFAVRVESYDETLALLESKGYRTDLDDRHPQAMIARPHPVAGYPQIYILDPDRHVIEINAAPSS
ncbi:MAG: VOC family protein [Gaiellaceae bacterium]|jgi:glyoxylase I family protein